MNHNVRVTAKGNLRITLSPDDARLVHSLVGSTAGTASSALFAALEPFNGSVFTESSLGVIKAADEKFNYRGMGILDRDKVLAL